MHHVNNNIDIVDTYSAAIHSSDNLSCNSMNSHTIDAHITASDSLTCLSVNTKHDTVTLGSSAVIYSSNTSVVSLAKDSCDLDNDANVGIQWAPSYVDDDIIGTTRRGTNRPSMLTTISHDVVYTQSAASGSDNHICILSASNSSSYHDTSTKCCTNNSI